MSKVQSPKSKVKTCGVCGFDVLRVLTKADVGRSTLDLPGDPGPTHKTAQINSGSIRWVFVLLLTATFAAQLFAGSSFSQEKRRPRAREAGINVGILPIGPLNAITDVEGVRVGHATIIRGDDIRTGVTVILPHGGNLFREKVPAAIFVGNGFGKLMGSTQVSELGEIETPIVLTSTLSVPRAADALLDYMLSLPGNEQVQSINPVVGETNDGYLNDIRGRHITRDDVFNALKNAKGGAVDEGSVGAGTGTVAFGFKGGIGTASRKLPGKWLHVGRPRTIEFRRDPDDQWCSSRA